jgi:Trk K+ transport system NAD-binding subunit
MAVTPDELRDPSDSSSASPIEAERLPLLIVAGDPSLARQLRLQLATHWRVMVVAAEEGLDEAEDIEMVRGDPTSGLVLEHAGASEARALIAAMPDAVSNLEVCRLAHSRLSVPKLVAVVPSMDRVEAYEELGAEVVNPSLIAATAVRNAIERTSIAVETIGLGQGELVQVTLQASSPFAGRALRSLHPIGWNVAAIFRENRLILPERETVLQVDDRLLLVGPPERLSLVTEYLSVGRAQFPLPYGTVIGGPVWGKPSEGLLREVAYCASAVGVQAPLLLQISGETSGWQELAERLDLPVSIQWSSTDLTPEGAVSEMLAQPEIGCLVVPPGHAYLPRPFSGVTAPLRKALQTANIPLFVPKGTFPYERVLFPVAGPRLSQGALQIAFDVAEHLDIPLWTVHVSGPAFLEPNPDETDTTAAIDQAAALRRRTLRHERRIGNPIAELAELHNPNQLMVLSHRRGRRWRSLKPDISAYLSQRYQDSLLILPVDPV